MSQEPQSKKSSCSYCGDASVNHKATFITGCFSFFIEPVIRVGARHAPIFFERFADSVSAKFLSGLSLFKMARFSDDIDKARSHRSRIIWEEAERRNIRMEQAVFGSKPLEFYRALLNKKWFYFQSLPIPPKFLTGSDRFDDKILLKRVLSKENIPMPRFAKISFFEKVDAKKLFDIVGSSLIVKPQVGTRGRHTTTNIKSPETLLHAIRVGRIISPSLSVEEHIDGFVCRATVVGGKLGGFYRASAPVVSGDGVKNIAQLIEEKNALRHERVEPIIISDEMKNYIARLGYSLESVPPKGEVIRLTHRTGRFYGGKTREMLDELHPSFIPFLERAANLLKISVVGFDCIVPDPTKSAASKRWGIIEANTIPFIDLHYFALEGKPKNIAGMIWDLWNK